MLSRFIVRHASHKSFSLPPVSFRYAQDVVNKDGGEERGLPPVYPIEDERDTLSRRTDRNTFKNISSDDGDEADEKIQFNRTRKQPSKLSSDFDDSEGEDERSKKKNYNEKQKSNKFKLEGKYTKFNKADKNKKAMSANYELMGNAIFGVHPVFHALQAQRRKIHQLYYKNGLERANPKIGEIIEMAKGLNVPVRSVSTSHLRDILGQDRVHQGVCCDASLLNFERLDVESLLRENKPVSEVDGDACVKEEEQHGTRPQLWLYMDRIQDPMNFGAILRSAYFMGVDKVLTSKENSCGLTGVVSKASAGAAEILPVYETEDLHHLFGTLIDLGWHLVSTAAEDTESAIPLSQYTPSGNMVLAVGNEGLGISADLQELFKTTITIQSGRTLQAGLESLNVSVATAVILHNITSNLFSQDRKSLQ